LKKRINTFFSENKKSDLVEERKFFPKSKACLKNISAVCKKPFSNMLQERNKKRNK